MVPPNFAGRARALLAPLTEGKPSLPNLRFSRAAPGRAFGAASWELTPCLLYTSPEPDAGDIQTLLDLIEGARKPLVLVGGGVIRSKGAVPQFLSLIHICS